MSLDIRQKINEFISERPEYALYKESEILSIMQDLGVISVKDVEQAKSTSTFGYGFNNNVSEYGLSVEKTSEIEAPLRPKEKSLPKKRQISAREKSIAREYLAQVLLQQALQLYELYHQTATNRSFGNEGMMELQELGATIVQGLDLNINLGISTPDTREKIYQLINSFVNDCVKMINCSEKEFERHYEFYSGKKLDYNNVIEYIEASVAFSQAPDFEKINPDSKVMKDLKSKYKNFQQLTTTNISKRVEEWSENTLNYGGLVSLGFDMALLYGTGGFSAIGEASMLTGKSMQAAMQTALKNIGMKKSVAPIIEQMSGITASQLTNAALSSTAFQTTKVIDALADGKVTPEEGAMLSESTISLFKFGYVGSAISGPLGAQVAQLTSRMLNSAPVINQVLKSTITNKPMPLTNVLKGLSEHSNALSAITNFGTSFSINAGYMAVADGMSYGEALESLAQMDAVSKMVAAFMGGKNTAFLTPQKVQQVKTELAGMKVNLTVYKGQKVFSITDKTGKVTHLANEQELMMFVADKIATEMKNELHIEKEPQETVAPFAERALKEPQIGEILEVGKPIELENGTFNEKGEFVSDGTKTKTTNTPFAKKTTVKETPMGRFAIAETRSEMKEQLSRFLRTNGERVDKNTLNRKLSDIDYLLKQKPGLTYADISEILINWNIIRLGHGCSDALGYNGITHYNVSDFNTLKENLSYLADKILKSLGTISDEKIEGKLTKLRSEYLSKNLSEIEPKEFQKNLDTLLALDSDLQFCLTRYNYNILFKTHEENYFNNLKIMNEYNKFINEYNKENSTEYETLYNSVEYLAKSDTQELKSNIEIAKSMLEDKIPEHIIDDVVPQNTTIYVDLYKQLKHEFSTKPEIIKNVLPSLRYRDEATRKTIIEGFKILPKEYIDAIHTSQDAYKFYNEIEASGEKGQKAFLLRAKMLTKLPNLIEKYGPQNKINGYELIKFLTEFKHPNLEKCLEFIELAEPNYLSKISGSINNYLPQDLDIYIANAKLHQELPKEFREFINREGSRTSFQYDIEPETLKQRVEKINKFNGQLVPEVLERIYNGSLNVNDNVLATFSKMEARLVVQMLSANLKFEHWNNLQQKTLDRIADAFKSVDHKKCENWTLKTNLASEKLTEFFTKLTDEELNILNPQDIFSKLESGNIRIDRLQKQIALIPDKLKPFVKEGNSTEFFWGSKFIYESKCIQKQLKELENLSNEELKTLGGHIIVNYLTNYLFDTLNPQNISEWKKVPQEIRDYLKENGIDFVISKETIDVELLRSRFESLKKTNAQKDIYAENLIKIQNLPQEKFDFMQKIFSNEKFSIAENGNYLVGMLNNMHSSEVFLFFDKLLKNPKFDINYTPSFIESFSENSELRAKQEKYIEALLTRDELSNFEISNLISTFVNYRNQNYLQTADLRFDYINKLLDRKDISANGVTSIMQGVSINDKTSLIKIIKAFDVVLEKENLNTQYLDNLMAIINSKFKNLTNKEEFLVLVNNLAKDKEFSPYDIYEILERVSDRTLSFINKISTSSDKVLPRHQMVPFVKKLSEKLYFSKDKRVLNFIEELTFNEKFPSERKLNIVECLNIDNLDLAKKLISDKDFPKEKISDILRACQNSATKIDYAFQLCNDYKQMELSIKQVEFLIQNHGNIEVKQLKKLNRVLGSQKTNSLNEADLVIVCQMVDIYGKNSINEIPQEGKKDLLRALVKCNNGLFYVSEEIKKMFPLIPTNQEAYCSLLPALVRSMGIETNTLSAIQVKDFNKSLNSLSERLTKISDSDFAALKITQEYSKEEFTRNVLNIVKDLSSTERQKVYDYFGFELHRNKTNETGFSIKGYPVNLNNGKKLAEITNLKTKEIVELLRPEVIKFSEQNPIKCNNSDVEKLLNEIVTALPELRTQIGKSQHKTHSYDVLQHSLKVMQKISQDSHFMYLNESDKKIMMLASLLHDVTKLEGSVDKTHANESSFDTFFIAKKFNLTREEEIKLYTLTKHHEWLEYVNTSKNQQELTKRLQSVAYDLQNDNLFEMALMFTHADLRAVKVDDSFHDTKLGNSRIAFDGTVRSFGESADVYARQIKLYAQELQKSQPLLPVTPIPRASRVNEAITYVNSDGSTNIEGVYKNSDGLIVIKYNEVENWEAIGFPKGSSSKGIKARGLYGKGVETDVETGNIKFFVHGLDYENQMSKFDAFSLVDSDVLLSISYTERPESKYRFFRPQGLLLNFDTKYIHGGGNTDSGSGCGKSISDFKKRYIFGGEREADRLYVSNLIKEATGMNDAEYVEFVKNNENKPFTEIEPKEIRSKIIQIFATINSNVRKGNREYNEMYGSNPKEVMAPFTYNTNTNETISNPIEFLNRESVHNRTSFLKEYALQNDKVFIVFGD